MQKYSVLVLFMTCMAASAQPPRLVLPMGHGASLQNATFSPDGKYVVTASLDETAKLWDVATGKLLRDMKGFGQLLTSAAFSPDGSRINMTFMDFGVGVKFARVLSTKTGEELIHFSVENAFMKFTTFSPDGKKLLASLSDTTVRIWDAETGVKLTELQHLTRLVKKAAFNKEGNKVLTVYEDSSVTVWDATTGLQLAEVRSKAGPIISASFSPDSKKILALSNYTIPRLWDASTGKLYKELKGHRDEIYHAEFNSTGDRILTVSKDSTARIWDAITGNMLLDLKGHQWAVCYGSFSPDGTRVVTTSWDKTCRVWDAFSGKLLSTMTAHAGAVREAAFSKDGKMLVTYSDDITAKIWDSGSGDLLADLRGHTSAINSAFYSPDEKRIVTAWDDGSVKIWDAATGTLLTTIRDPKKDISFAGFTPVTQNLVMAGYHFARIWNTQNGQLVQEFNSSCFIQSAEVSRDEKRLMALCVHDSIEVWDIPTKKLLLHTGSEIGTANKKLAYNFLDPGGNRLVRIDRSNGQVKVLNTATGKTVLALAATKKELAQFSPDGSRIITIDEFGRYIQLWDAKTGKKLAATETQYMLIDFLQFSADGKQVGIFFFDKEVEIRDAKTLKLLFTSEQIGKTAAGETLYRSGQFNGSLKTVVLSYKDNTIKLFDTRTGKMKGTFFPVDSSGFIMYVPQGYFQSSTDAAKLSHYVTKDLQVISFEQLDVKFNRPDKVLEAMGNTDTVLVRSYRKAWEKRIKKLGIDTSAFSDNYSVPASDFANRNELSHDQKEERVPLHIHGSDSSFLLDRFNIWVNETPVFGQRGVGIRHQYRKDLDTTIMVTLSAGVNRIETSVTNVNGTESYRMPLLLNYKPALKTKETLHFIGIGMDRFAEAAYNLQYSSKDIRDLAGKLIEKYGNNIVIDTLFNEQVTVASVKALKQKLLQSRENDKVIIAYSGHGMLSKDFDYYLSTYAVNFEKPEENGLPYEELENLLDSIPARKKLMLIDACHSGEVDKEDLVTLNATPDSLVKGLKPVAYKKEGQLGLKNSFELMQSLFVNVGKTTGATIISAAAGTQFALERNDLKNGVFTYSILEAMNKYPGLKISELKSIVGKRVEELTKGLQKPTSRNEPIAVDWNVW